MGAVVLPFISINDIFLGSLCKCNYLIYQFAVHCVLSIILQAVQKTARMSKLKKKHHVHFPYSQQIMFYTLVVVFLILGLIIMNIIALYLKFLSHALHAH